MRRDLLCIWLAGLALGLFALRGAHAQALPATSIVATPTGGRVVAGTLSKVGPALGISANSGGAVSIAELITGRVGQAANASNFQYVRQIPAANIGRVLAKALPFVGTGLLAYELFQSLRCEAGSSGILCDPGIAPNAVDCWKGTVQSKGQSGCFPSKVQALEGSAAWGNMVQDDGRFVTERTWTGVVEPNGTGYQAKYRYVGSDRWGINPPQTWDAWVPIAVEFMGALPQCKEPGAAIGPDGKCPLGQTQLTPEVEAGAKVQPYLDTARAVDYVREALERGVELAPLAEPAPNALTGPLAVEGPLTTVQTLPAPDPLTNPNPAPVTTTTQIYYQITYQGDTYNYTTTTTKTNPDGSTETQTEENNAPISDAAMPEVPKLYERAYPDGLIGVWAAKQAAVQATPIFSFLQGLVPQVGSGGGCPVWQWDAAQVLGIDVGGDLSVPCYVWSALRVIFTVSALLAARKLIFGG